MAYNRLPPTTYPTISPNVKTRQYTGDGRVAASVSRITSTASLDFDIDGSDPLDCVRFEQDLLGTAIKNDVDGGYTPSSPFPAVVVPGDVWVFDMGAYTPSGPGATTATIFVRKEISKNQLGMLSRTTPAVHPIRPYMRASHIAGVQGLYNDSKVAGASPQAKWRLLRYSVNFETLPYLIKEDGPTLYEWERYVSLDERSPYTEFKKRQHGVMQFPEGVGLDGRTIPRELAVLVAKEKLKFTWHHLPDNGLFNNGGFYNDGWAPQIELGLGRVNRYRWRGYNPGTLLFESWKAIERPMPCEPMVDDIAGWKPGDVFFPSWDVEFNFTYFEPPVATSAYPGVQYRTDGTGEIEGGSSYMDLVFGHNCVPRPDGTNRWYRAFTQNWPDYEPAWLYQTYDFNDLFRIWR